MVGVSDVRRNWFSDDRVTFTFQGVPFVINEPWGDNSRYWVGPLAPEASGPDISPLHSAFVHYRGPLAQLWAKVAPNARDG